MAKFYSARSKTISPLPWQAFALTFSKNMNPAKCIDISLVTGAHLGDDEIWSTN